MWWIMVSLTTMVGVIAEHREETLCEDARLKCAYREGCGMALNNYIIGCSAVLQGPEPTQCPEICQHALIALTSTEEGQDLMTCKCSDDFCEDSKRRVEVCRPEVVKANMKETIVSCEVAHWICSADNACSTALDYYHKLCKTMFHGIRCSHRCLNSIAILSRQEKASKLQTCRCDGREGYNCQQIRTNMKSLCFKAKHKKTKLVGENGSSTTSTTTATAITASAISTTTATSVITDPTSSSTATAICVVLMLFVNIVNFAVT